MSVVLTESDEKHRASYNEEQTEGYLEKGE